MLHTTWTALCNPGLHQGACRRKLVKFALPTIYGSTGITARQRFRNAPRVEPQPMFAVVSSESVYSQENLSHSKCQDKHDFPRQTQFLHT